MDAGFGELTRRRSGGDKGCSAWKIDRQQIYTSTRFFILNSRMIKELTDRSKHIRGEFGFPRLKLYIPFGLLGVDDV